MKEMLGRLRTGSGIYRIVRYIIIGGMTTFVSVFSFWLLERAAGIPSAGANAISIVLAVAFAYVMNKAVVFRTRCRTKAELIREAASFISARAVTMLLEFLGVLLAHNALKIDSMISKGIVTVVVIILNYILSRRFVFNDEI